MRSAINHLAGVAQLPERSTSSREVAGAIPAPRSIHLFPRSRPAPRVTTLAIVAIGLLAAIASCLIGFAGYAGFVAMRGLS